MLQRVWIVSLESEILWYLFSQGKFLKTKRVTNTAPFLFAFDFVPAKSMSYSLLWGSCWDVGVMASPFPSVIFLLPSSDSLHVRQWSWALEHGKIPYAFGLKVKCLSYKPKTRSNLLPAAVTNIMPQNNVDTEGFHSSYTSLCQSIIQENRGSDGPRAGTEAETTEEQCLLGSSSDLLSRLSYSVQGHLPWHDIPTVHRACFCHGTPHACWIRLLSNKWLCME